MVCQRCGTFTLQYFGYERDLLGDWAFVCTKCSAMYGKRYLETEVLRNMKINLPEGDFLKAKDVKNGMVLEIEGELIHKKAEETKFGKEAWILPVKLSNGESKNFQANLTSMRELEKTFGDESKDWVGKKISIQVIKQNVSGELKPVIYARALEGSTE